MSTTKEDMSVEQFTERQQKVLVILSSSDSEWFYNHDWIMGGGYAEVGVDFKITYNELSKDLKVLRDAGYVEYARGLMNDDGELGGSGNHLLNAKYNEVHDFGEKKGWL